MVGFFTSYKAVDSIYLGACGPMADLSCDESSPNGERLPGFRSNALILKGYFQGVAM
jgi:hypothetical protein